jgi:7-keto-8-aminopelargonate synthetase-like enzyme
LEISEFQSAVGALHGDATRRGLFFQTADDTPLQGRRVCIGGREVVSFSSCSYLGLEFHPALIEGVQRAAARYGTQFSTSRGYLSAAPYRELEARLSRLFGGHALVTSTTSVGHQVALGALLTEQDAVVLDHQVHFSVQAAAQLARTQGATVEVVRHNHLERAVEVVRRLAATRSTVWFATDGVFSMYGDLAPLGLLRELLDVAPNVRLYVDDAHGMSWAGLHGRGSFLSRMPLHPRMVLATSLNKAFAAGGGCLVFPAAEERERVLLGGGPMVFSGPLQPPMLGAALASAALHLSPEIEARQAALRERTRLCNQLVRAHGLPLLVENESPIFFIPMGLPRIAMAVAERMLEDGFYVNVSAWPSVPMKRSGLRFSVTALHELDDIRAAFDAFARHVPAVLDQEQVSRHELDALFARAVPREALRGGPGAAGVPGVSLRRAHQPAVHLERFESIHEVDRALWDQAMGGVGACSWEAMALQEAVFSRGPREYRWAFRYLVVRDVGGDVVAVTFYTVALNKDDMLMRAAVSQAVEERRAADPYFLTSEVVMMGSGLSEGNHLALDRSGPWQEAVLCILEEMGRHYDRADAAALLLRDLPGDDPEMDALMARCGLVKVPMFASHNLALCARHHGPQPRLQRPGLRPAGRADAGGPRAGPPLPALPQRRGQQAPAQRLPAAPLAAGRGAAQPGVGAGDPLDRSRPRRAGRRAPGGLLRGPPPRRAVRPLLLRAGLPLHPQPRQLPLHAVPDGPPRPGAGHGGAAPGHGRRDREVPLRRAERAQLHLRPGPGSRQRRGAPGDRGGGRGGRAAQRIGTP